MASERTQKIEVQSGCIDCVEVTDDLHGWDRYAGITIMYRPNQEKSILRHFIKLHDDREEVLKAEHNLYAADFDFKMTSVPGKVPVLKIEFRSSNLQATLSRLEIFDIIPSDLRPKILSTYAALSDQKEDKPETVLPTEALASAAWYFRFKSTLPKDSKVRRRCIDMEALCKKESLTLGEFEKKIHEIMLPYAIDIKYPVSGHAERIEKANAKKLIIALADLHGAVMKACGFSRDVPGISIEALETIRKQNQSEVERLHA